MPELQTPERFRKGMKNLVAINDEAFEELVYAIDNSPLSIRSKLLVSTISSNTKLTQAGDVREIIRVLVSLSAARSHYDLSTEEVVDNVVETVIEDDKGSEHFSEEQKELLKTRLRVLLRSNNSLSLLTQANEAVTSNERTFLDSRILTDIRPIFSRESNQELVATVVIHSLIIQYKEAEDKKEFFIALDANDLNELRKQLDIAEEKAKAVELLSQKVNIPCLNPKEEKRNENTKQ